jgi:hypothetical protein
MNRDLLTTVIERWRSATMSHRMSDDEFTDYAEAPALQPAPAGPVPVPPSPRGEALRSSLLKKPLDAASFGAPPNSSPPGYPPKFR